MKFLIVYISLLISVFMCGVAYISGDFKSVVYFGLLSAVHWPLIRLTRRRNA